MNISDSSALRNCTSCLLCAAICPHHAITIQLNKDGFYRPVLDESLCVNCGKCTAACYKFDEDFLVTTKESLNEKKLFAAWACDDEILKETTSGGLADILAHQLLEKGYKVVGVIYDKTKSRARHIIANTPEQLVYFRGSKYIQSFTLSAFRQIIESGRNEKYAIFGTPCQIYALRRIAEKRRLNSQFFFIDIYCHGCPSFHVWEKYLEVIKKKSGYSTFDDIKFRSKKYGWGKYCIEALVDGQTVFLSQRDNKFFELFFSDFVLNESCYDCKFRSSIEYCDIRLGDFWGSKYIGNHKGVSAVTLSSKRGESLFNEISGIDTQEHDLGGFLPNQSWGKSYHVNPEDRQQLLQELSEKDTNINKVVKVLRSKQNITTCVIRNVKHLLSYLPLSFNDSIRRIVYMIRQ